ncbi:MAG: hypothetical protein HY707_14935, partial [Ignavibacteriae bacterium]|nr:hypothetical protein [Ignavibacteriota bacterium]
MKRMLLFSFIVVQIVVAQKRYLVSPYGDYYPLKQGESAIEAAKKLQFVPSSAPVCTDKATFGYNPSNYPLDGLHISCHKDIFGMWYVTPAAGTIDSVFFFLEEPVGTADSTLYIRIHKSNIYPGSGPGYGGYPPPGAPNGIGGLCWGYYINTNDFDGGVAAFPEEATDTSWFSTLFVQDTTAPETFPPTANELWGLGGYPVRVRANEINFVRMLNLGYQPNVTVGEKIFISLRVDGPHSDAGCAAGDLSGTVIWTTSEADQIKTHNWKFYEHTASQGGLFCGPGWIARGFWNNMIWYSMTVTTNIPPVIFNTLNLANTFSTAYQTVTVDIEDCNPAAPATAGVKTAVIRWSKRNAEDCSDTLAQQPDISLSQLSELTWEGTIPGQPVGTFVSYRVVATDSQDFESLGPQFSYRVVSLRNQYYYVDTSLTCVKKDIRSTGTEIPLSAWFEPMYAGSGTAPRDDGTAGPFDIGGLFDFGGSLVRYAWVGINGAIALSASATDTLDVNSSGFATGGWDFPNCGQHNGRSDTAGALEIPSNFIAGFWADFMLAQDSPFVQCGRILYGNGGDTCQFVVEWDSIGAFDVDGPICDETTFRIILNRCDGSIEVQYNSVGTTGLDSAALVGLEVDSASGGGWIYVNKDYEPYDTKPRNDWCIQFYP